MEPAAATRKDRKRPRPADEEPRRRGGRPASPLPPFKEWQHGDGGNTLHRLQLVAFNFYRAVRTLERTSPLAVLRAASVRYTGANEVGDLCPLWVVTARADEVLGPARFDEDWSILGRYRDCAIDEAGFRGGAQQMIFAWSTFPQANRAFPRVKNGRWDDHQKTRYVRSYIDIATRTMLAMVDAAHVENVAHVATQRHAWRSGDGDGGGGGGGGSGGGGEGGVCFVFNPAGGGAFLRGLGQPLESEIAEIIPCLLCAAFLRCRRLRPATQARIA